MARSIKDYRAWWEYGELPDGYERELTCIECDEFTPCPNRDCEYGWCSLHAEFVFGDGEQCGEVER